MPRVATWISTGALGTALLLAPFARADEPPEGATAPVTSTRDEARARFARGIELFDDKEFERALVEFERSYELSSSYRVLYNIGRVNMELHRYARAVKAFERYLADGGEEIPETRAEDVKRDLKTARARTAKLLVRVKQPESEISVDEAPLATSPMDVPALVDSGSRRINVRKQGFQEASRLVTLAGGDSMTVDFDLEPTARFERIVVPSTEEPNRTPMWLSWGVAGAFLAGTATFGLLALGAAGELDTLKAREDTTQAEREDQASKANSFATVSTVLGAATLVTAGVAVYLTLRKPSSGRAATSSGLRWTF
jgi:tetratricopeptide (TPR) repeat protein